MSAEDFASWGVDVPRRPPPAPTALAPATVAAAPVAAALAPAPVAAALAPAPVAAALAPATVAAALAPATVAAALAPAPVATARTPKVRSLLRARANAVLLDGLIVGLPLVLIDVLMGALFPHAGFFSTGAQASTSYALFGPYGLLLMLPLWLSYFAVSEALTGQTIGKRWMGLRVISVDGGPAGVAAVSARSLLRLVDDLGFYVVGLIPMLLTGERRRRFGDLAGRTLVVRVESTTAPRPRPGLRAAIYPVIWLTTVLVVAFGVGFGAPAGAGDRAVALVRAYQTARSDGNGALACSLLAHDQQRELVARVIGDYRRATAAACPQYVLTNGGQSTMVAPTLAGFAAGALQTRLTVGGGIDVRSSAVPSIVLTALTEKGHQVLDARGLGKLSFVDDCNGSTDGPAANCLCIYEWLRAQQLPPFVTDPGLPRAVRALAVDAARCRADPTRVPA